MSLMVKLALAGVILLALGGDGALAQGCTAIASCSTADTCQLGLFGRHCGEQRYP
jgi:hypothetical protein